MGIKDRLQKLHLLLAEKEIEAILISQPQNRYYLSGFDGSSGLLLITPQKAILATDFRYIEQAQQQAPEYEIFKMTGNIADWFLKLVDGLRLRRLGFEAEHTSFDRYRQLSDILDEEEPQLRLMPTDRLVESLRALKEPEEIEFITRAMEISDNAFDHTAGIIHAGMSEQEIAWELEKFMRENGSESLPFNIIVASGPNSALPHAKTSPRIINDGEPVVIDMGARLGGYGSDLSRTICLGSPDKTFKKIYNTVLKAQQAAITKIEEGMTGEQADSFAREIIEQEGYGEAFGHSLGHGVGLAPHELPHLGPNSTDTLTSGMAFTIEPGIYLPGWGGVRIEDTVIMQSGKIKLTSKAKKEKF